MDIATPTTAAPTPAAPTEAAAAPPPVATEAASPAPTAAPAPTPEMTELERIRAASKGRVEEQRAREAARAQAVEEARASLRAEYDAQVKAAREQAAAETREAIKRQFHTKPVDAITEMGLDGAQLIGDVAKRAGQAGPVYDEIASLRAELAELREAASGVSTLKESFSKMEATNKAYEEQILTSQRAHAQRQLLEAVTAKSEAIPAYFGGADKLSARAQEIADEYCQLEGKSTCPYDVVVSELAAEAKRGVSERLKALDTERSALAKLLDEPRAAAELPAESKGLQATRTLSSQSAGERHATPKPRDQMTAADLDEAMRAAARAAIGDKAKASKRSRTA